jgi:hypothetical protein
VFVTEDHWLPLPIVGHRELDPRFTQVAALRVSATDHAVAMACCKSPRTGAESHATIPKTSDPAGMGRSADMDSK